MSFYAPQEKWDETEDHRCEGRTPSYQCGPAITYCYRDNSKGTLPGSMWAGNGEYESQINYCPFCGAKAVLMVQNKETA